MKIKFFLLFLPILFAFTAQAQYATIKGIIADSTTKNVLPNATININFGQKLLLSDSSGSFSFSTKKGEISITVKYLNYLPYRTRFILQKDTLMTINMADFTTNLDQVTVSSKSSKRNVSQPIMGVNSLNIKEIKKIPMVLGEVDVLRGVQMLPGVTSVGEASNGVNIRGGTTDQNLMLLDDAPIFNPTHLFGLFSAFPSEAISGFDLFKGNIPSRFGGRTSGVLEVTVANPSLTKSKLQFGIGLVSQKIFWEQPIIKDRLAVSFNARLAANDWILPLISDKIENIKAKFGDANLKLFYKINEKNTFTLSTYGSFDKLSTNLLGGINNINSTGINFDYRTLNYSAKWFKLINDRLNIQTSYVNSNYAPITLLPELNSKNEVKIEQNINFQQLKSSLNYQKGKNNIEFGIELSRYLINPGELVPGTSLSVLPLKTPIENGIEAAIFGQNEIAFSPKVKLSLGLRHSNYITMGPNTIYKYAQNAEKTQKTIVDSVLVGANQKAQYYSGFEPRVGLNINLNDQSSIKLGYNTMRQYLQLASNTTTPIPTSRWKSSDYHIKPQQSQLYSLGYFKNMNENIYEFSSEVYYKITNNVIDFKPGASFLLVKNIETELLQGVNKAYGLELMLAKKKGELTGWINYSYARSLNQINQGNSYNQKVNNGNWYAANYDKPHTFNAAIVINQAKTHDFSFNFTYSTGRPFTAPSAMIPANDVLVPFYAERNNSRIPSYHRLDFSWNIYNPANNSKKFKGNWNFTIYNLYGRKNAYSVYMKSTERVTNAYKLVIFGAPIPSISYNFKLE
jgi:hypothetical protein